MIVGAADVPPFDEGALIAALRTDQAGKSSFLEFLTATWKAGVIGYDVDFAARTCAYHSAGGEKYVESYPSVEL